MLTLLGLLIASYLRLNVNRVSVARAERWSVDIPFSIYLGWITVATVANITDWLYLVSWNGIGIPAPIWAVIMIAVASVLGIIMLVTRRDVAYAFVLVWSFVGIAIKQTPSVTVIVNASLGAVLLSGLAIYSSLHRKIS
jgi:hypothetical protein